PLSLTRRCSDLRTGWVASTGWYPWCDSRRNYGLSVRPLQGERQWRVDLLALLEQTAELVGVLDQHAAVAVLLGGDQPRQPEAQAGDAQHGRPQLRLGRMKAPQARVGAQQGRDARRIQPAIRLGAPVVHANGHVIEHRPGAGVVEVDHPAQVAA